MATATAELRLTPDPPLDADTRRRQALARRLAVASVGAVIAAALCYLLMVRTGLGQRFDNAAYVGARQQYGPTAEADSSQLQRITADSFAFVLLIIVAIGAVRRRIWLGLGAAFAAGIAVVGTDLLKNHILTRPDLMAGAYRAANSFPSGHTATAVACAMALVLLSPPRWRGVAAVVAGAYGWVTAAEVETAGWHRPSDAIGAAFLAFAAVSAVAAVLVRTRPVRWRQKGRHVVAQSMLALVGLAVTAVAVKEVVEVLRYLRAHELGVLGVPEGMRHDAYIGGLAVTVEVVVVLLMLLLGLLGRADLDGWGWGRRAAGLRQST